MRIGFLYNSQNHQILHSLPTALELSILHPDWQVEILVPSQTHLDYVGRFIPLYPGANVVLRLLRQPLAVEAFRHFRPLPLPPKVWSLLHNRAFLNRFDALVTTEKTSLWMRRFGVTHPKLVNTEHGAGDRDVTFDPRVARFDFNLIPSPKTVRRLLDEGYLREGAYALSAYAKFDIIHRRDKAPPPLFTNGRPTVLYNPHFEPALSSWPGVGMKVLDLMAAQDRYNLVFAPHMRLFHSSAPAQLAPFARYKGLSHMLIDLGSDASCDMTYTMGADLYLGDVSSQVYEFLCRPRPCVFLNTHDVSWRGNPNYRFWTLGPVLSSADVPQLLVHLDAAFVRHGEWREAQEKAFAANFDLSTPNPGRHNAQLLAQWLSHAV
ncbi:sensor domain-containing protein [Niveispirillum sp.]|uniref:sensor domain-containing protein n=1 Tax=Niveispirillum sp. TaxID=1917217 RepID=UPI001B74AFD0|nr:sensor domain-containing protein [Niveispirillum sp.]MBP7336841.1 sensor domain-containing protein [Niveispirillum sp.]